MTTYVLHGFLIRNACDDFRVTDFIIWDFFVTTYVLHGFFYKECL